ncbi:MAG TPA: DUF192 domain-containing protein [Gammaproteobacteria bacterium]|nr:DUF192 domain-containing protein [Gammaproteobacteria bacterium]
MRAGRLYLLREESPILLIEDVMLTGSVWERMRGLLRRPPLREREALLIDRCASVHTWGMRYPLDLAFMDRKWKIRKLARDVRPWRMAWCRAAAVTLEMQAGTIDRLKLETGMQLVWQESAQK